MLPAATPCFLKRTLKKRQNPVTANHHEWNPNARSTQLPRSGLVQLRLWKHFHNRKNALFFRTEQGAAVGDILMSVIETRRANGIRAWDYFVQVTRNAAAVRQNPAGWLPWTYASATG